MALPFFISFQRRPGILLTGLVGNPLQQVTHHLWFLCIYGLAYLDIEHYPNAVAGSVPGSPEYSSRAFGRPFLPVILGLITAWFAVIR